MLYLQTGANRERNHQDELRVEELKGHQLSLFLKKFSNFLERMHLCLLYAIQFPETLNVTLKIFAKTVSLGKRPHSNEQPAWPKTNTVKNKRKSEHWISDTEGSLLMS